MPECSLCRNSLRYLGGPGDGFSPAAKVVYLGGQSNAMDQWSGSLCFKCGLIFCNYCLNKTWVIPACPICGKEMKPVFERYLKHMIPLKVKRIVEDEVLVEAVTEKQIEKKIEKILEGKRSARERPKGHFLLTSYEIVTSGGRQTHESSAQTVEDAYKLAETDIPQDATVLKKKIISSPKEESIKISAFSERQAMNKVESERDYEVVAQKAVLKKQGKRGFLGIGGKPHLYEVQAVQNAVVEVTYKQNWEVSVKIKECKMLG